MSDKNITTFSQLKQNIVLSAGCTFHPSFCSRAERRNWAVVFGDGLVVRGMGGRVDQGQGEQFPHACLLPKARLRQAV